MLELTVRLVASLAIVVGLLLVLARFGSRRFRGATGAVVQVVHRQPLSRTSSVAVVAVGSRVLVLGTTEQQVSMLAELDPEEIDLPVEELGTEGQDVLVLPAELSVAGVSRLPQTGRASSEAGEPATAKHRGSHRAEGATVVGAGGPLSGSVLSPQTWKQAYKSVTALGAVRPPGRRAS